MYIVNEDFKQTLRDLSLNSEGKFCRNQFILTQRFLEYLYQYDHRYRELVKFEEEMISADQKPSRKVAEIQLSFVNELEAFFEQFYSTLSTFAVLLLETTAENFIPKSIGENNEKLINFLKEFHHTEFADQIKKLEEAKTFRNNIVHYKKQIREDWMILSRENKECVVIYYKAKGTEIYFRGNSNPDSNYFEPPVNYETFYLNPSYGEVFRSLKEIVESTLKKIAQDINSRPKNQDGVDVASVDAEFGKIPKRLYLNVRTLTIVQKILLKIKQLLRYSIARNK